MKKLLLITIVIFLFCIVNIKAQITLEHSYYIQKTEFWVTDIGNNDYKYVFEDSSGFSVYNLDHSIYLSKVVPPQPLFQLPHVYEISYLTKSLFDCDSTNVEYALSSTNYEGNYYVYRTDGTLIFEKDSVTGPYCAGCNDGSTNTQPIYNTPNGAKLMLFNHLPTGEQDSLHIYSLCGKLPENYVFNFSQHQQFVKIFPNPASSSLTFEISLPDNINKYELVIFDNSAKELRREKIGFGNVKFIIDVSNFSSGVFYYSLASKNKVIQTGKFILTK
jgi:hypothetical protein